MHIFSWKMTGRLQLCYLMYELCFKLHLSILSILFRRKPLYGWNLPQVRWMLQRLATQIWQLSKIDRVRSAIILVWPIRSKVEQESSPRDGCLAFCHTFVFTKVQRVVPHCKLASYCKAKATNLKTASHQNMWTV